MKANLEKSKQNLNDTFFKGNDKISEKKLKKYKVWR